MNIESSKLIFKRRIAAIIPARNEAGRIGGVLSVLARIDILDEIIVVDDGSSDQTASEVKFAAETDFRIKLIQHNVNQGKGQAIFSGTTVIQSDIILLLDADLSGLSPQHVLDLICPVVNGQVDMTIGLFRGGNWWTDLPHKMTPWLTGQRCLSAGMIDEIPFEAAKGYGFETALTVTTRQFKHTIKRVYLRGVSHPVSEVHLGVISGLRNRIKMYRQIIKAWKLTIKATPAVRKHDFL